jgi:hypothetical protein
MNFPPRAISLRLPAIVDNCHFAHRVRGETYIPCEKFITAAPCRGGSASCRNNLVGRAQITDGPGRSLKIHALPFVPIGAAA